MGQGRYVGKHRKPRERQPVRALALIPAAGLVIAAAVVIAVTDDPRWLRLATLAAVLGALLPTLALRRAEPAVADDTAAREEIAELRREIARLRADVAALAAAPRPRPAELVSTTLQLPLVRAAFADAATNGDGHDGANGHRNGAGYAIDLTGASAPATSLVHVAHDEEQ